MATNAQILRTAIRNRQQVTGYYDGFYREMCPHAIGWKGSKYHVLSYQFAGQSSKALPPDGQWECMDVEGLSGLSAMNGPWHTGTSHTRPATCFDPGRIEVEVSY